MSERQGEIKRSSLRPKIISIPRELNDTMKNIREIALDLCMKYWSYHCEMYLKGIRENYKIYTFSLFNGIFNNIYFTMDTYDVLALSTVCLNKKLTRAFVTPFKEHFHAIMVQDNKLLPLDCKPEWHIGSYTIENLIKKHKIKNGIYCGCRFDYFYEKIVTRKCVVNQFLYFTHKTIDSYLTHNKIDPKGRLIPSNLPKGYVGVLKFVPKLYCIWSNEGFVMYNIMAFEVGCHKQGYGDQWPRPKIVAPRFIFQSTNEELQKILNLEPVKQVVEKMKQALINKILRQIQLNVSKLGER